MSKTSVVVAGVNGCVAAGSATVVGLAPGDDVIVPASAFFPSLAASLGVASID
jgi:dTDP-4-amino-4,6-dideoxygalactose transaminase